MRAPRHGWGRRLIVLMVVGVLALVAAGMWMNRVGGRMLARHLLIREAAKAGMHGDCVVDGTLLGGLAIRHATFTGDGALAMLRVDRVNTVWHWREIFSGKLRSLEGEGITVMIDHSAGRAGKRQRDIDRTGTSPAEIWAGVTRIWERFVQPVPIDVRAVTVHIRKDGQNLFTLAPSGLTHAAGSKSLGLALGDMAGPAGIAVAAQSLEIAIGPDAVGVDHLSLPGNWVVGPVHADPVARTIALEARHAAVVFHAKWDVAAATLAIGMDDADWDLLAAMRPWLTLPGHAAMRVSRLHATARGIDQPWPRWHIDGTAALPVVAWDGWQGKSLQMKATWADNTLAAGIDGGVHGAAVDVDVKLTRGTTGFKDGKVVAKATTADLGPVFAVARERYFAGSRQALHAAMAVDATVAWHAGKSPAVHGSARMTGITAGGVPVADTAATLAWPDLAGSMAVALQMSGKPGDGIEVKAEVDPKPGGYAGTIATAGNWRSAGARALLGVAWSGTVPDMPAAAIRWQGNGNWHDGTHRGGLSLDVPAPGTGPFADATIALVGSYAWPATVHLAKLEARTATHALGMSLRWENNRVMIDDLRMEDKGVVVCRGNIAFPLVATARSVDDILASPGPVAASLTADPRPLEFWQQWLPENKRQQIAGTVGASLTVAGDFATPLVDVRLAGDGLALAAFGNLPPAKLMVTARGDATRRLQVKARLEHADIEPIELMLGVPFNPRQWIEDPAAMADMPVEGKVQMMNVPLAKYAAFAGGAREISGTGSIAVEIKGKVAAPDIRGRISIGNARYVPRQTNLGILDRANLVIDFTGSKARVTRGEARLGEGTVTLSGGVDFTDVRQPAVDVKLSGDHVMLWRDDDLLVRASPVLGLTGKPGAWKIAGHVALVESLFFRDFEIIPIGRAFTVPQAPQLPKFDPPMVKQTLPGWLAGIALDARVFTEDPILIRGNLATGMITAAVTVKGTVGQPSAGGRAILHDAVARLPFSSLKVAHGEAEFVPGKGWVPELHVNGESTLPPYKVNVAISGPANDPHLNLSSEPPLPPSEILALLASGSTTASLENTANAQGKAMQLLITQLRNGSLPFGRRLGELLAPMDHIQVQVGQDSPYDGRSRNGATIELTDRLLLSGAVDTEGNQRLTLTLLFRFR